MNLTVYHGRHTILMFCSKLQRKPPIHAFLFIRNSKAPLVQEVSSFFAHWWFQKFLSFLDTLPTSEPGGRS